jgi:hypothetical protein
MSGASGVVLGFLLATAYGAGFHFIVGGPARRIILYLLASWIGFALGHVIGDFFGIEALKLGAVYLLTASVGSWIALIGSWWLSQDAPSATRAPAAPRAAPRRPPPADSGDAASRPE